MAARLERMLEDVSDDPLELAAAFDTLIDQALDELQAGYGHPVYEDHPLRKNRVVDLAVAYRDNGEFSTEHLRQLVDRATDVKLQIYLTSMVTPGLLNIHCWGPIGEDPALASSAKLKLIELSLRQDLIVKSRILWERLMGLIYFIETGKPDVPKARSRSTRAAFFAMCRATPRWKWVVPYEPMVTAYDRMYRTPEVHKRSFLRAGLSREVDDGDLDTKLLQPLNDAMNQIWDNVRSIVGGGGVVSLGRVHVTFDEHGRPTGGEEWYWQPSD